MIPYTQSSSHTTLTAAGRLLLLLAASTLPVLGQMAATSNGKFVGNVISSNTPDPVFDTYWNQVTPENSGKWESVEGTRDVMNWSQLDYIYTYTRARSIPFKLHTFVWGQQTPAWVTTLSAAEQREEVEEWIAAAAARYPATEFIDVVNEPIPAPAAYRAALGGAGATGWDWVIWSFEKARQYFPNAKLLLNDYNVLSSDSKTTQYLAIINLLKDRGLIDGIGEQAHFFESTSLTTLQNNLNRLTATGLPIYISELDIDLADDTAQSNRYQQLFPLFWTNPAVRGITFWGYKQGQIWRTNGYLLRTNGSERPAMTWMKNYMAANPQSFNATVTAPTNGQGVSNVAPVSASATVAYGTAPFTVTFQKKLDSETEFTTVSSDTTAPYTADLGNLPVGTYQVRVSVTDSNSATVTSTANTFNVFPAAGGTWLGTSGNWNDSAIWAGGTIANGTDATASFTGVDIAADQTITLNGNRTIGNIVFTDTTTPSHNLSISGADTLTLDLASGAPVINVTQADRRLTVSNVVAGNDGLLKAGSGALTLSGGNTYTGTTTVNAGTLRLEGNAFSTTARAYSITSGAVVDIASGSIPTGTGAGATTISGGGTLRISGAINGGADGRDLNLSLGAGSTIDIAPGGSIFNGGYQAITWTGNLATLNVSGTMNLWDGNAVIADALTGAGTIESTSNDAWGVPNVTLGINNGSGTFSGNITAAGARVVTLTKSGTGTQSFSGTTTFRGTTTINAGTLQYVKASSLYAGVTTDWVKTKITVNAGCTIAFNVGGTNEFTAGNVTTLLTGLGGAVNNNGLRAGSTIAFDTTNASGGTFTLADAIANTTSTGGGAVSLRKLGDNTLVLPNNNTYSGTTIVDDGTLAVTGSLGATAVSVNGGTLAGNGNFGGNVTIGAGAMHSLAVASTTAGQDTSAITGTLAMAESTLNLTAASTPAAGVYVLATATTSITGLPLFINYNGITGTISVDNASNPKRLLLTVTSTGGGDTTAPTLVDIVDDKGGSSITVSTTVNYTVTFSEDINASTVTAADFGNAGTSLVTYGAITETSLGVFTVAVTPTSAGTLQLRVNAGAVITDVAGNALNTTSDIADDTTITVNVGNASPVWTSNPVNEVNATEDANYNSTLADNASDANGDALTFTKVSGPAWLIVAANGTLSGTPANSNIGPNSFTVSVSDGIAPVVEATLNITVTPLPTFTALNPADNATGVAVGANLVATFNKNIAIGTGDITIKNLSDATQTIITLPNGQVTVSGATLTINPTADLAANKNYAIQIAATAIDDTAGNSFGGIADDTTWNFATSSIIDSDGTWLPTTAGPFNWGDSANWAGGITATGADFTANFTPDITAGQTVNLAAPQTIGNITFTDSTSSNNLTISGGNILTLDRASAVPIINVTQSGRTLTISSQISGSDGLSKVGGGSTLALSGNNDYTGTTVISDGNLAIASNNALGATSGNTTITAAGSGPRLLLSGGINSAENISIGGSTESGSYNNVISSTSGTNTLSGNITLANPTGTIRLGTNGGNLILAGTINQTGTARALTLAATGGEITLNNAIANGGAALSVISQGGGGSVTLKAAPGTGIGAVTIGEGGMLKLGVSNAIRTDQTLTIGFPYNFTGSDTGTFDLAGFNQTVNGLVGTKNTSNIGADSSRIVTNSAVSGTNTLTVGNGNATSVFSGVINDGLTAAVALTKTGTGTLTLVGNSTYSGVTTISGGIIAISHANALGSTAGNTTIAATGASNGPQLTLSGGINSAENITITGATENSGFTAAITNTSGNNTLSGNIIRSSTTGGIRLGSSSGSLTFSGTLSQTTSTNQLTFITTGTGSIIVNNAIANNGGALFIYGNGAGVTVKGVSGSGIGAAQVSQGGTLKLGATDALNTGGNLDIGVGTVLTTDTGTFDLAGFDQTVNALSGIGTAPTNSNRKVTNSAAGTGTNTLTVGNGNGSGTFNGVIQDGTTAKIALIKTGSGTQTLAGVNTYSGNTTISQGTLTLNNANANNQTSTVTIAASGATLNLAYGGTDTVNKLFIGATQLAAGEYGNSSSVFPIIPRSEITGTGTLTVTTSPIAGNTAPTISDIANQSMPSGGNTGALAITVGDVETPVGSLTPSVSANTNTTLVPNGNIVFGGSGTNRTVTVTPVSGLSGSATITIRITDGGALFAEDTFTLTVTDNYLSWATANNVTGGENGDHDNDGVKNLVEYALVDGGENGVLSGNTITFTKRGGVYGNDLTYVIETSETLASGSWSDAVTHGPGLLISNPTISYTFTPGTPLSKFARLKVGITE